MKGSVSLVLASSALAACSSVARPSEMPEWAPELRSPELLVAEPHSAAAPLGDAELDDAEVRVPSTDDDAEMRVPRTDDDRDQMRVPRADYDDQMRVPRKEYDPGMRVPSEDEAPKEKWPASGLYVGGALITSQPMGDFQDGDFALFGPSDVVIAPELDVGAGAGIYLSYRWHMNEVLLQYSITEHDGEFDGSPFDHDTKFYDLDLNWRHYFWESSALQPYALFGLGWSRADVDNGTTDQATGTIVEDAHLENGIAVNVGAGAALYTLPWVVFFGQGMWRFVRYGSSQGLDGNMSNTPDIDGDGWNLQVGAAIRILPPRD
jgi:hypothetical protein